MKVKSTKKKKKKKSLSNRGGKNTSRQALGPPPGPHNYFKGTQGCVIPGSGKTWGRRRWLLVLIPVNPPNSPKPNPGEAKAAQHCPGAQGPLPLSSLKSMAELASFSSHVAYDAPNRARHHSEQHRGCCWVCVHQGLPPSPKTAQSAGHRRTHLAPHAPPLRL